MNACFIASDFFLRPSDRCMSLLKHIVPLTYFTFVTNVVNMWQEFLKKEQERKEAELLAEKQEVMRKRKEEKRVAREVKNIAMKTAFPTHNIKRVVN